MERKKGTNSLNRRKSPKSWRLGLRVYVYDLDCGIICQSRRVVLPVSSEQSCPPGDIWRGLETPQLAGRMLWQFVGRAGGAAKCPTMHSTAPTAKDGLEVGKPALNPWGAAWGAAAEGGGNSKGNYFYVRLQCKESTRNNKHNGSGRQWNITRPRKGRDSDPGYDMDGP